MVEQASHARRPIEDLGQLLDLGYKITDHSLGSTETA